MPNRVIKESLFTSEKVAELKDFDFRLWISLILLADDYGRGDARPAIIKGRAFPLRDRLTNKDIESSLGNLAAVSCVDLYEVDGRPYYQFPNWSQHQRVRNAKRKYPLPETANNGAVNPFAANCGELSPISNPIQSESNPDPTAQARDADRPNFDTAEVYATSNLTYMSPRNMEELADFKADLPDELIRYAIDEACGNGSRHWNYVKAILNSYVEKGFKTIGDVKAHEDVRKGAKQPSTTAPSPKIKFCNG